jgi:hypothetical protein
MSLLFFEPTMPVRTPRKSTTGLAEATKEKRKERTATASAASKNVKQSLP